MSMEIISQPQLATPSYNDLFFVAKSTNKSKDGFRYIAELFINGAKTHEFKIVPFGANSYGKVHVSKIVSSYLTQSNCLDGSNSKNTLNESHVNIQVKWGEEYYSSEWSFEDYSAATLSNWTNYTNLGYNPDSLPKTMIYNTTGGSAPPYSQGDYITISQKTVNREEIEGVFRVLDVENVNSGGIQYMVVLDLQWIGTGASSGGVTSYSDNRKTKALNKVASSTIVAFNGALSFEAFKGWNYTNYLINETTKKFLTDAPRDGYVVRPQSVVFLNALVNVSGGTQLPTKYTLDDGTATDYNLSTSNNLIQINASVSETTSQSNNYTVTMREANGTVVSEAFQIIVDNNCYGYDFCEIIFLDRLGSILPFQFTYKIDTEISIKRETSKRDITTSRIYSYNYTDAGEEVDSVEVERTLTLRTTRLNTAMATYFQQLVTSGWTAIRIGDSGQYIRCNVVTNSLRLLDRYADGLKRYEIKIKYANKDIINW